MSRRIVDLARLDQFAAALRDAEMAVTASDLTAGPHLSYRLHSQMSPEFRPGGFQHAARTSRWHQCTENGCFWMSEHDVRADIKSLHPLLNLGLAARQKIGNRVYWSWTGESIDMAEFEEALLG